MVSPTKHSEHAAKNSKAHGIEVVAKHRLAEGSHSSVFPEHIGESQWHKGARKGHTGHHSITHKTSK